MRVWSLTVLAMMLLAGCAGSAPEPTAGSTPTAVPLGDPVAAGDLTSQLLQWELLPFIADGSAGKYPIQFHGEATIPDGDGPYPLAIFMHGRHSTCRYAPGVVGFEFLGQPCPRATPVMEPVDSYTGYRYLAENLASHGIAVISVSANDVNDYDLAFGLAGDDSGATARGRLILKLLDEVAAAQAGSNNGLSPFADKLDLDLVGLMGHSRGGEGVIRAATLAPERIDAVMALAPTDFARWVMPSNVAFGTILPYCDGDVSNLQGAWAYDDMVRGTKHQFLDMGANHNFYNTVWTGDDWGARGDRYCDVQGPASGRLSPEEQQAHGVAIMGSFFRYYLGEGADLWPLLEGSMPFDFDVKVSSEFEVGHSRASLIENDGTQPFLKVREGTEPTPCKGTTCPIPRTFSTSPQLHLKLADDGFLSFSEQGVMTTSIRGQDAFTIRVGLHPDTTADALAGLRMFVRDAEGKQFSWILADHGLFVPPGDGAAKTTLNMVYLPLELLAGVDRDAITTFGLRAGPAVELQFADWHQVYEVPGGPRFYDGDD